METVTRRRSTPFAILVAVLGVYWLALFAATHLPFSMTPKNDPYSLDKLQHGTAFAVFAVLLCAAVSFFGRPRFATYLSVLFLVAVYAAIDEFTQQFVPNRTADFRDWLADMCGAVLGVLAFAALHRIVASRQLTNSLVV